MDTLEAPRITAEMESGGRRSKSTFLLKTYAHLYGAFVAFAAIEYYLFTSGIAIHMARFMLSTSWLLILGGFTLLSWVATHFSRANHPLSIQYAGLGLYVVGQAILFVPLLFIADYEAPGVISAAIYTTLIGFLILTAIVAATGKDFSFLRGLLMWGSVGAVAAIVGACVFNFALGTWFDLAMIVFAGAAILYDTSKILKHYGEDGYVAASLQLFASVALLLWYVIRLFLGGARR